MIRWDKANWGAPQRKSERVDVGEKK